MSRPAHGNLASLYLQAGSVDNATSSFPVEVIAQPLFLHFKPRKLMRGHPAAVLSWFASDQYGLTSEMSKITIDISCDHGYAISLEDASACVPCQPGFYNLPDLMDQVWAALLCHGDQAMFR